MKNLLANVLVKGYNIRMKNILETKSEKKYKSYKHVYFQSHFNQGRQTAYLRLKTNLAFSMPWISIITFRSMKKKCSFYCKSCSVNFECLPNEIKESHECGDS